MDATIVNKHNHIARSATMRSSNLFFGGSQVNRRNHIARSATIGGRATIFFCGRQVNGHNDIARSATIEGHATSFLAVAKLTDATILPGAQP